MDGSVEDLSLSFFFPLPTQKNNPSDWSLAVLKPEGVETATILKSLAPGVAAFTALHYLLRAVAGESILILDSASV